MKISQTPAAVIPLRQRVMPSGGPPLQIMRGTLPAPSQPDIAMGDGSSKLAVMIGEVTFKKGPIFHVWAEAQNPPPQGTELELGRPLQETGPTILKIGADAILVDTSSVVDEAAPRSAPQRSLPADPASDTPVSLQGGPGMADGAGGVILMPDGTYRTFSGFGGA